MIFLDATAAEKLELADARLEALRYSNLCKANGVLIARQEKIIGDLAKALGKEHQSVLDAQALLEGLKGKLFGKSTERRPGSDGPLFDNKKASETEKVTYDRKKRTEIGRTPQPELPRITILHELSEEEMRAQGLKPMDGQFETSEVINVTPSRFQVEEHKRQKYVAIEPESSDIGAPAIVTAPGPLKLKEGSRYSPAFGVECGIGKFQWHLPLDRQVRIMKAHGLV